VTAEPLRVGVAGVRRVRQGLGEHFARWLVAAGAEVPAFLGRTPASIAEGKRVLAARGIEAEGYLTLAELLEEEPLDALVIASPAASHLALLEQALTARLHVLCEKPFVWDVEEPARAAAGVVHAYEAAGLVLAEHCQWPETLPAYFGLHPGALDAPVRRFEMELSPSSVGEEALLDTVSHPLSLLQAALKRTGQLRPGSKLDVRDLAFDTATEGRLGVGFTLRDEGHQGVAVDLRLRQVPEQPRPAAYAFEGRRADRRIVLPGYEMRLADGAREVPLQDPMRLAVGRFVHRLRGGDGAPRVDPAIEPRMAALERIVLAFRGRGQ
jgi:hypothetical protein